MTVIVSSTNLYFYYANDDEVISYLEIGSQINKSNLELKDKFFAYCYCYKNFSVNVFLIH